jgi:hypothetical protein
MTTDTRGQGARQTGTVMRFPPDINVQSSLNDASMPRKATIPATLHLRMPRTARHRFRTLRA